MTQSSVDFKSILSRSKIQFQSRSMSEPTLSGVDLKIKWLKPELPLIFSYVYFQVFSRDMASPSQQIPN